LSSGVSGIGGWGCCGVSGAYAFDGRAHGAKNEYFKRKKYVTFCVQKLLIKINGN